MAVEINQTDKHPWGRLWDDSARFLLKPGWVRQGQGQEAGWGAQGGGLVEESSEGPDYNLVKERDWSNSSEGTQPAGTFLNSGL